MPESLDYGLAENHSETDKFDERERTDRKRERESEGLGPSMRQKRKVGVTLRTKGRRIAEDGRTQIPVCSPSLVLSRIIFLSSITSLTYL